MSLLAFHDRDAEVVGLSAFPRNERPNPVPVHLAFQVMLACGIALAAVGATGVLLGWKRRERLFSRPFLCAVVACGPLGLLAGWGMAQHPYLVRPDLPISSSAASPEMLRLLLIILAAGGVLLFPAIYLLFRVFKKKALFGG